MRASLLLLASSLAFGCGSRVMMLPDTAVDVAASDALAPDVAAPDALVPDVAVDAQPAVRCAEGSACDALLDADGLCPARCVPAEYSLRCRGSVHRGLCFDRPPLRTEALEGDQWRREPVSVPEEAAIGEAQTVVFAVVNTASIARPLTLNVAAVNGWSVVSQEPAEVRGRELASGERLQVTLTMRPSEPTALDAVKTIAANVSIEGSDARRPWPLVIAVRYAEGAVSCGGRVFPEYHPVEPRFSESVCCDGVFYPAAQCCVSADCRSGGRSGRCNDGRCEYGLTTVPWSSSPLAGPQRIVIALVDSAHAPSADPCEDRSAALRSELGLEPIEQWFDSVERARVGRATASIRWTVFAGLRASEMGLPAGPVTQELLHQRSEAWLRERGCLRSFDADYDRTLVYSPSVSLDGHSGRVFRTNRIAQNTLGSYVTAHEIAHTFGARDRYTDIGGFLQWADTLMSNCDGAISGCRDDVLWGEVGLGDLDRDGVIDLHQSAQSIDALTAEPLTVTAFPMVRALGYSLHFTLRSGGRALRGAPQEAVLSIPGTDVRVVFDRWDALGTADHTWTGYFFAPRDIPNEVFDNAARDRRITVRVQASYHSTRADFTRHTLTLDETREVSLAAGINGLVAPRAPRVEVERGGCH